MINFFLLESRSIMKVTNEDPNEVSYVEDRDKTFLSMLPPNEDEVFLPQFPLGVVIIKKNAFQEVYQCLE
jgi:hypothetical protein